FAIPSAREGINFPSLKARDLCDDVRRCAKAIDTKLSCLARFNQGAVTNQPGAKQRRCFSIGIGCRDRKTESFVRHCVFCITAVERVACIKRLIAQVLTPAFAEFALSTRPAQPRDPDALAGFEALHPLTQFRDSPHDFMPRDQWQLWFGQFSI